MRDLLSSSVEDGVHEGILGLLLLPLLLVLVEQLGRLHDETELEQAEKEESDASHQPHLDRGQRLG